MDRFTTLTLLVVLVGFVGVVPAAGHPADAAPAPADAPTQAESCDRDAYDPPELDRGWEVTVSDSTEDGSLADWDGGRLLATGPDEDCSLALAEGDAATLTATSVNGTYGVVTATLDFGKSGALRLDARNSTAAVAVSNPGPSFGQTLTVTAAEQSTAVTVPTGRFVDVAIFQTDGTVEVALWDTDEQWDGEWDARVTNVTAEGGWQLSLDGEVLLDGLAVGELDPGSDESDSENDEPDDVDEDPEDDDPFARDSSDDFDQRSSQSSDDDEDLTLFGGLFFGLPVIGAGVLIFRYAYGITRFGEQLDAIGSKTSWDEVEPAEWNVLLTKGAGVVVALFGLYLVVMGVL